MSEAEYKSWYEDVYGEVKADHYYDTPAWRKLRRECLYRDSYRCVRCEKKMRAEDLSVHHIIPRSEGGPDVKSNLMTLCNQCHDLVETLNLKSYSAIVGSYKEDDAPRIDRPLNMDERQTEDNYKRPEWHKWVYGGCKRRRK